ncbi:MAG: hypothetical protein Kow0047_20790 [Anaerolineae bacterium]
MSVSMIVAILSLVVALALGGSVLVLWRRLTALEARYERWIEGTSAEDLEEVLEQHIERVQEAVGVAHEAHDIATEVAEASRLHIQHCGIVRFNPFAHTGGDQSFCIALADATGRGIVITSLHAREGTRIYAKPLIDWSSPYPLIDEERMAIDRAFHRLDGDEAPAARSVAGVLGPDGEGGGA